MFGVTSVLGPLAGGLLVDHASWRWVFYINLPLGVVALLVTGAFLPAAQRRVSHVIDYLGAALMAAGTTCLVLMTSLGGTTYAWGSPQIVTLGVAGVVLLALFVAVERRAEEPILPLRLFKNRVFGVSSALGFVVGFAMFGAITFLPVYLQIVKGVDPTVAGLRLLPLMVGLLLTSVSSGQLISRTGHYKIFPIVGTALMTIGLLLLSRLGPDTSWLDASLYMFVFGMGLGSVMQVTVIATQNAVDYKDLGAATSGVTYFRSMGGSFGTTVFGSIFSNRLTRDPRALPRRDGAAGRRQQRDAEPRRAEPALPRGPRRRHPCVRRRPPDRLPGRGAGRRLRLPDLVAAAGAQAAKDARRRRSRPDVRHADRPQLRAGARTRPRSARGRARTGWRSTAASPPRQA